MHHNSFKKDILIRLVLQLPVNLRGFIVLPLLTRTYTQDVYGVWLQILLIKEVLIPLLSLRLETALIRYLAHAEDKPRFIKAVFTITVCCSLVFIMALFSFPRFVATVVFGTDAFEGLLLLAAVWICILACMHVGLTVLRSQGRITRLSIRELLSTLWMITSVVLAYVTRLEVNTLVVFCIIGDSVLLVWTMIQIGMPFPIISPLQAAGSLRQYITYTLPLIFNSVFLWFTKSIDRFLIIHLMGLAMMSVYGVSLQVANLLGVVLSPINFVLFPRAAAAWKPGHTDEAGKIFSQALTMTLVFSAPVAVGLFVIAGGLIPLLAGSSYTTSLGLIFFLLTSVMASMVYQNHLYIIHMVEKTCFLPLVFIFTAVLNYFLGYLLISHYGLLGAALARCTTMVVMAGIITLWAQRYIKISLPWVLIIKIFAASVLMGVVVYALPMRTWTQLILAAACGMLVYTALLCILRVISRETLVRYRSSF